MPFADLFGGSTIYPSDTTYLALTVSADVELQWPIEQAIAGANIVADIVDLNPTGPGFNVDLPDARQVSNGYTALFNNVGGDTVTIRGSAGATLVSLTSGTVWQLYLTDNSTAAGTWRVFQYGASVSVAVAAALAGAGLKAISTTLNQSIPNRNESSTPVTVVDSDRAMLVIWTGGLGDLDLPNPVTVGSDWFIQLRNSGSGNLTVTPASGNIDDASTKVFAAGTSAVIVTDGSDYYTIGFGSGAGGGGSSFDFLSINVAGSGDFTLSGAQLNRIGYEFTGVLTGNRAIIVPNSIQQYWVTNGTTGAFSLTVETAAQVTGIEILQGNAAILYCNGTDVVDAESSTVTFPITVALGGTGAVNATNARANLGVSYADPSATVGPTATNGATGTVMDAGSAPALDLTADYNWSATSQHSFAFPVSGLNWPVIISSDDPGLLFRETDAASDNQYFGIRLVAEQIRLQLITNAGTATTFAAIDRTAGSCDSINWVVTTFSVNGVSVVNAALFTTGALNDALTVGVIPATAQAVGYRGVPSSTKVANYNPVQNDNGNIIYYNSGGALTAALGALADSTVITLVAIGAGTIALSSSSGTLSWYTGAGISTGARTIASGGVATVHRRGTDWSVWGTGLS